jgi:mannitol/fructose-specific phosphotransferase system IIA component (Ntr-type)
MHGEAALRLIVPDLQARTREGALSEMAEKLAAAGVVPDAESLTARLLEREQLGCTGLGSGLAIPHCQWKGIDDVVLAIGRSRAGIDFRSSDAVPVTLLFLVLSPADAPGLHLQALAQISRRLKTLSIAEHLRRAETSEEMREAWKEPSASLVEARS